jgi:hypothetical protein
MKSSVDRDNNYCLSLRQSTKSRRPASQLRYYDDGWWADNNDGGGLLVYRRSSLLLCCGFVVVAKLRPRSCLADGLGCW